MRPEMTTVAALVVALGGGCGTEGELTLRLLRADFDDPFANLVNMRIQLLDAQLAPIKAFDVPPGVAADLGSVDEQDGGRVLVSGLDAGGQIAAQGQTRALSLEAGTSREELVPFSTPRVVVALPIERATAAAAVQVDGTLGEWVGAPSVVLGEQHRVLGPKKGELVLRGELMVAWSQGGVWFALRVFDRCPGLIVGQPAGSCGPATAPDRIAFGFDGAGDGGSYGADDLFAVAQADRASFRAGGGGSPETVKLAFGLLGGGAGWTVEGSVSLAALGRASLGRADRLGFELTLIDETPGQPEPTVLRLSRSGLPVTEVTPVDGFAGLGFGAP